MLLLPPCALTLRLVGLSAYVQPGVCVTVTVRPATVSVPVLAGPSVAATRNATTPAPLPVLPLVMVSHGVPLSEVHAHPAPAVTGTWRSPPEASTLNASTPIA